MLSSQSLLETPLAGDDTAGETSIAAWDSQRQDMYGDVAGKDWLANRRALVDAKLAQLDNALHAAPAEIDQEQPPPPITTESEAPKEQSAADHFASISPQKAYASACDARGASETAKELRKSAMPRGPAETKLFLLQSDLTQHINFGPVKFRQLEDEVLALQHALVSEIAARKAVGFELDQQRSWLYEQYSSQIRQFSEQGGHRLDELWAAAEGRVEQAAEKALKLGLRKDMQMWEEEMDDKVNVLAKEVAVQISEESENKTRALHNFESTLKARYTNIQDELLKNRKDRAATEDLMMGFLDKLTHHESLADCQHLFKLKVKAGSNTAAPSRRVVNTSTSKSTTTTNGRSVTKTTTTKTYSDGSTEVETVTC